MLEILRAHGLDAGPTQRPLIAGALSGIVADGAALPVLASFGSLDVLGDGIGRSAWLAAGLHVVAMCAGGALYGQVFRRAANDTRGAWLFGLAYGFLLWMIGAVPLLQWWPTGPLLVGGPAAGVLLGQLAWGLALGVLFPFVHRPLKLSLADAQSRARPGSGLFGAGRR